MSKRALMLADADSIWTKIFIEDVLLHGGYEVTLFPIWGYGGGHGEFYEKNRIAVYHDAHTLPVVRHIPRLRMWARVWLNARSLERSGDFELVVNQYLSQRDLALGHLVSRRFGARWVASFVGSDLLRASDLELTRMRPYLRKCDGIAVQNTAHIGILRERMGERVSGKAELVPFGQNSFRAIDEVRALCDKRACKAHFGIAPEDIVICPGYNAAPENNHISLLEAIAECECLSRSTVVLQMTYCKSDEYIARVEAKARELGIRTLVLTEFMNATECAYLRLAADIYLHAIVTDAFSTSLCEYMYAGAVVIKGAWLKYPQLDEMGVSLTEFGDYCELAALIDSAARGGLPPVTEEGRARIGAYNSWDTLRPKWLKLLEGGHITV